jgi:4-amino-4-deoxy-L-arabinose transferase-like glycosyltransferase
VSWRNPAFPQFFFVHEHFARFLTTVHQRVEPWWYFLPLLLIGVLPWLAPLARACRSAWYGSGAAKPLEPGGAAPAPLFRPLKFLLLYAAVTLVFFSMSGSKLAPYILPMLPVLAALTGASGAQPQGLARQAARINAVMTLILAAGLLIYSARKNSFVPHEALGWALGAGLAGLLGMVLSARARSAWAVVTVAVLGAILALQCMLCEYTAIPPAHSSRELVSAVRVFVGPDTPLYSVGQYRETVSPYLGRTLQLAGYEGELRFGLDQEPQYRMSLEQFAARWSAGGPAVAFFDPELGDAWRRRGLPGRVIAADYYTVAVSRL